MIKEALANQALHTEAVELIGAVLPKDGAIPVLVTRTLNRDDGEYTIHWKQPDGWMTCPTTKENIEKALQSGGLKTGIELFSMIEEPAKPDLILTSYQIDLLTLTHNGLKSKEIAESLGVTVGKVKSDRSLLRQKLGIKDRIGLGLIPLQYNLKVANRSASR